MKKYFFVSAFFLIPFFVFAQSKNSIDAFMDIPFGSDSATVKAAIFAKGGIIKIDTPIENNNIGFINFSMGQRQVKELYVNYVDNKAYNAFFFFQADDDSVLSAYSGFVADLKAVYGKPREVDDFNDLSNTNKLRKLKAGNIAIKTVWQSKNKNTVSVNIIYAGQSFEVMLRYEDSVLFELNASKRRSDL